MSFSKKKIVTTELFTNSSMESSKRDIGPRRRILIGNGGLRSFSWFWSHDDDLKNIDSKKRRLKKK